MADSFPAAKGLAATARDIRNMHRFSSSMLSFLCHRLAPALYCTIANFYLHLFPFLHSYDRRTPLFVCAPPPQQFNLPAMNRNELHTPLIRFESHLNCLYTRQLFVNRQFFCPCLSETRRPGILPWLLYPSANGEANTYSLTNHHNPPRKRTLTLTPTNRSQPVFIFCWTSR